MSEENSPGVKHDQGKPRFSLIPPLAELEVVKVLTFGAEKYSPDNWRKIEPVRYVDAAGRHINAHRRGEPMDAESGLHHLAHAICCLMFQLEKELENELEYGQVQPCDIASVNPGWKNLGTVDVKQATEGIKSCIAALSSFNPAPEPKAFTVIRQGIQTDLQVTDKTADEFSMNNPPLIGQEYYYLSNTGVLASRRWQSTPQEWKRLHKGQVFKNGDACREKGYHTPYIFHEDDPVSYPEIGKEFWHVEVNPVFGEWQVYYFKVGRGESLRIAQVFHRLGQAASGKEQAEAKALWRNLSMQRYGTPYGPLHPDAEQYDEPLSGSDEGEEHD